MCLSYFVFIFFYALKICSLDLNLMQRVIFAVGTCLPVRFFAPSLIESLLNVCTVKCVITARLILFCKNCVLCTFCYAGNCSWEGFDGQSSAALSRPPCA